MIVDDGSALINYHMNTEIEIGKSNCFSIPLPVGHSKLYQTL